MRKFTLLGCALAVALVACLDQTATQPSNSSASRTATRGDSTTRGKDSTAGKDTTSRGKDSTSGKDTTRGGKDSSGTKPDTAGKDTTRMGPDTTSPAPAFTLVGRALGVTIRQGTADSTFTPIAQAVVKLARTVVVNGKATQVPVGETTSRNDGSWSFSNLIGGAYIATATAPAGSPFTSGFTHVPYVRGNTLVRADIYVWP